GQLLAPHRAKAGAAQRERDRHAVHGGDGVEHRPQGVVQVVLQVAGGPDVHHEEDTIGPQGASDAGEHLRRVGLVVDGVEGGNQVEAVLHREDRDVPDLQVGVRQAPGGGFGAAGGDALLRDVVAGEAAVREGPRHEVNGVPGATADVQHVDARLQ